VHKTRKLFFVLASLQVVLLIIYLTAILTKNGLLSNIMSPICAFTAAFILIYNYKKNKKGQKTSFSLLLFIFACLAWGLADVLWLIFSLRGIAPESNLLIMIFYALTNLFILLALLRLTLVVFKKWDLGQYFIDLITVCLLTVLFIWIVFIEKDTAKLSNILLSDYTGLVSIISSILIYVMIHTILLAIRSGKVPFYMCFIASGILLFSMADVVYYYLYYHNMYCANSFKDFISILSLSVIALGGLLEIQKNIVNDSKVSFNNKGRSSLWFLLFNYPIAIFILQLFGVVKCFNIIDFFMFVIIVLLYLAFSKYVQLSLNYHKLLMNEKNMNVILEERVAEQVKELKILANQDSLTGLHNRIYFINILNDSLQTKRANEQVALVIINMDRFKTINDHYGHNIGDSVLIEISNRLKEWNNYGAEIARLSGDEFAVLIQDKYSQRDIEEFCQQIIALCDKKILCGQFVINISVSIGAALLTENTKDANTLLKNADIALFMAKSQGYSKYHFYNELTCEAINHQNEIEALLKQTEIEKELELYYQPLFSLPSKELVGAEALVRWKNPTYGYMSPGVFIPIAERCDYILRIGAWVMKEAIRQAIKWNTDYRNLRIAFNISPKQLKDETFISEIKNLTSAEKISPSWLETEITESVMLDNEYRVYAILDLLKKTGLSVSVDDFGSGYSSLAYLTNYPFDKIKIDKTLIDNLSQFSATGINIVKAIITMAKSTGITTVAEGVETQEQLDILTELGCDQVQGFLLGRPVPADVFESRFLNK
jgi:diguanylate cyclase (GGDEF)-like protein